MTKWWGVWVGIGLVRTSSLPVQGLQSGPFSDEAEPTNTISQDLFYRTTETGGNFC